MENVIKGEQLYEGKAKKVYATNDPDLVIVDYQRIGRIQIPCTQPFGLVCTDSDIYYRHPS